MKLLIISFWLLSDSNHWSNFLSFSPGYTLMSSFHMTSRFFNIVLILECLGFDDFLEHNVSELLLIFQTRVNRPPFQCIHESLSALFFFLKELCNIKFVFLNLLVFFLVEFLANLIIFIENYLIFWFINIKAVLFIFWKRTPPIFRIFTVTYL